MLFKKTFRLLVKIVGTPPMLLFFLGFQGPIIFLLLFVCWVYELDNSEIKEWQADNTSFLKQWFTTL